MGKQRLRMKDLVTEVFLYLSRKFEQSDAVSINHMVTSLEEVRDYLNTKFSISYTSNQHIFNQLRSYEDELGVRLFKKVKAPDGSDDFSIMLEDHLEGYKQKQLLYITQKIKIANAVFEKILHENDNNKSMPIKILLGAGTEVYYVARALVSGTKDLGLKFQVYTHNLGVINYLLGELSGIDNLEVFTRYDWVDPMNNILIGTNLDHYMTVEFDYIIQAATYISDGKLYIDSPKENIQKREILNKAKGLKILVLTKHEFISEHLQTMESYGSLNLYDYVIIPFSRDLPGNRKEYAELLEQYVGDIIEPDITHYNYKVYKVIEK